MSKEYEIIILAQPPIFVHGVIFSLFYMIKIIFVLNNLKKLIKMYVYF